MCYYFRHVFYFMNTFLHANCNYQEWLWETRHCTTAFRSETVFYPCTRTRVTGCLSFNLTFHLSQCCRDLRSSADWSTSAPTTKSPSLPGLCPSSTRHWCHLSRLSGLQPSLHLRLRTAQSHAGTQPYIRSWSRHRRHRWTTTTTASLLRTCLATRATNWVVDASIGAVHALQAWRACHSTTGRGRTACISNKTYLSAKLAKSGSPWHMYWTSMTDCSFRGASVFSILCMVFHIQPQRRSVVVSGVGLINEVNRHWARLVLGWVTVCGRVNHLGM